MTASVREVIAVNCMVVALMLQIWGLLDQLRDGGGLRWDAPQAAPVRRWRKWMWN